MDKVSYALGLSIGNNFENSGIKDLQVEDFVKGLTDVLSGNQPAITYDEAKEVINDYFMKLQKERLEINKKAGEEFLNINRHKAGVVELPSGLQYEVLKNGTGAKPTLPWHIDQRHGFRQLRTTWRTGRFRRIASDPGLGRGIATDAGWLKMAFVHPVEPGLWREWRR